MKSLSPKPVCPTSTSPQRQILFAYAVVPQHLQGLIHDSLPILIPYQNQRILKSLIWNGKVHPQVQRVSWNRAYTYTSLKFYFQKFLSCQAKEGDRKCSDCCLEMEVLSIDKNHVYSFIIFNILKNYSIVIDLKRRGILFWSETEESQEMENRHRW